MDLLGARSGRSAFKGVIVLRFTKKEREVLSRFAREGGIARAQKLTTSRRRAIARMGGKAAQAKIRQQQQTRAEV